jgi:hypothetical protein
MLFVLGVYIQMHRGRPYWGFEPRSPACQHSALTTRLNPQHNLNGTLERRSRASTTAATFSHNAYFTRLVGQTIHCYSYTVKPARSGPLKRGHLFGEDTVDRHRSVFNRNSSLKRGHLSNVDRGHPFGSEWITIPFKSGNLITRKCFFSFSWSRCETSDVSY